MPKNCQRYENSEELGFARGRLKGVTPDRSVSRPGGPLCSPGTPTSAKSGRKSPSGEYPVTWTPSQPPPPVAGSQPREWHGMRDELTCDRTTHAARRMKQRSISEDGVELVLSFGVSRHCGRGCESYSFDNRSWRTAARRLGRRIVELERFRDLYLVVSPEGAIVTAAWRH
jgi:hypothetical protein